MILKGKVVLITGASGGIGRSIALECARQGAITAMTYRTQVQSMEETARLCEKFAKPLVIKCDVTAKEDVIDMFRILKATYGRVDGLVNNAGIVMDRTLANMKESEWKEVIGTNLSSLYYVTKPSLALMKKGGSIVNMSSVVGILGNHGQANYAAAKAGVIGFTRALARELGPKGIRVNAVAPGFIKTPMTKGISFTPCPLERPGEPFEVANAVVFLLSSLSSYITGEVIRVDGGLSF